MLKHLLVENFILIQQLELNFREGYTVISGETGAGKSILVGALGLILGRRADTNVLQDKEKKCILEGSFQIENLELEILFKTNDIDFEPISTFRREITPQGKSRAFINDTPVTLSVLKEIGDRLVDIHSQNQTLELNDASFQLSMIDSYANSTAILSDYKKRFSEFTAVKSELAQSLEQQANALADKEYKVYLFDELSAAHLQEGEQEELENELEILTHAEEIRSRLVQITSQLGESDPSVLSALASIKQTLSQAAKYNVQLESFCNRLDSCFIELKDFNQELQAIGDSISYNPEKIEQISQRLNLIYHLQQKHRVQTIAGLLQIQAELELAIVAGDSLDEKITTLQNRLQEVEKQLSLKSEELYQKRQQVIPVIESEMLQLLSGLGMPSAAFAIRLENLEYFTKTGTNRASFLFSANKGIPMREIQKAASGGELSRLMLALKSLIVSRAMLPTVLFDEIDTGISGEIAGKVGAILKKMARTMQVIAITHLPQIAAKADTHLLAYKEETDQTDTISNLRELTREQRIDEVARMLSNEKITTTARAAALELME